MEHKVNEIPLHTVNETLLQVNTKHLNRQQYVEITRSKVSKLACKYLYKRYISISHLSTIIDDATSELLLNKHQNKYDTIIAVQRAIIKVLAKENRKANERK